MSSHREISWGSLGGLLFAWYQTLLNLENVLREEQDFIPEMRAELREAVGDQVDAVAGPLSLQILHEFQIGRRERLM